MVPGGKARRPQLGCEAAQRQLSSFVDFCLSSLVQKSTSWLIDVHFPRSPLLSGGDFPGALGGRRRENAPGRSLERAKSSGSSLIAPPSSPGYFPRRPSATSEHAMRRVPSCESPSTELWPWLSDLSPHANPSAQEKQTECSRWRRQRSRGSRWRRSACPSGLLHVSARSVCGLGCRVSGWVWGLGLRLTGVPRP